METKYKGDPGEDGKMDHVMSESSLAEIKAIIPDYKVPDGITVQPDGKVGDVELVITRRYTGKNAILSTNIPFGFGRCCKCNHVVIVSKSSPQGPLRMCTECAIDDGKVPNEWIKRLKD